jgi:hypothetical protein
MSHSQPHTHRQRQKLPFFVPRDDKGRHLPTRIVPSASQPFDSSIASCAFARYDKNESSGNLAKLGVRHIFEIPGGANPAGEAESTRDRRLHPTRTTQLRGTNPKGFNFEPQSQV